MSLSVVTFREIDSMNKPLSSALALAISFFCLGCANDDVNQPSIIGDGIQIHRQIDLIHELSKAETNAPGDNHIFATYETVADVPRWSIFHHAASFIRFQPLFVGDNGVIEGAVSLKQSGWENGGDGVRFRILAENENRSSVLLDTYIDPKNNPEDRKWHPFSVSLDDVANSTATITFETLAGEGMLALDTDSDWGLWGNPVMSYDTEIEKPSPPQRKNIVLITIDTHRQDYLGRYGNPWIETGSIDQLAGNGVLFRRSYSTSSTTNPSHISILTGLYPYTHGVVGNNYRLSERIPRLQQVLRRNGYKTGASVAVMHLKQNVCGLGAWFDRYEEPSADNTHFASLTRSGFSATSSAISMIEEFKDDPFFLWVHYYDPHTPYIANGEYHRMFYPGDPRESGENGMAGAVFKTDFVEANQFWLEGIRDLDYFKKEYGAEIAYVDDQIGRLMQFLRDLGLEEDTMVVLTADHGENLGEHDIFFDHWFLYDTEIHVPLIISHPDFSGGAEVNEDVSGVDIAPTILELAGVDDFGLREGFFEGRSLVPLMRGDEGWQPRTVYANALFYLQTAAMKGRYKAVWELRDREYHEKSHIYKDRVTIYDRLNDPAETDPIARFFWNDEAPGGGGGNEDSGEYGFHANIMRVRDRSVSKPAPSAEDVKRWLNSDREGTFIAPELKNGDSFYSEVAGLLEELRTQMKSKPLADKLRQVGFEEKFAGRASAKR